MSAFKGPKLRLGFASNSRVIHFQSINFNQTPICRNLISFLKKNDVSYNKLRCQNILYLSFPQDSGMSGAAGTYMDAAKAHKVGMIPYNANYVSQIGNTSLIVAREILLSEDRLWELQAIAKDIVGTHGIHLEKSHCILQPGHYYNRTHRNNSPWTNKKKY